MGLERTAVREAAKSSKLRTVVGFVLIALGLAVFAVRLQHEGPYAMPRGGNLFGGVGALLLGGLLLWPGLPRTFGWIALVASPVVLFSALYATMAELDEVVSLYATDRAGWPAELRLWIVDREDGAWVGMARSKALEHSLDGARLDLLRRGETRCVVPTLHEDRPTVRAIHALKVERYAVARAAAAIGLYPREARDAAVSLRLDPCPSEAATGG
ncbi:MAG: hypothetical protein DCC71_04695 [Proteobacteria bacterium]|nr:MAG: hypothetical protein DCC71_04695 [Pseudomonadota bacterium]